MHFIKLQLKPIVVALLFFPVFGFAEMFGEEVDLCIYPDYLQCSERFSLRHEEGELVVYFNVENVDQDDHSIEYLVEFDNRSSCGITIANTTLRHGRSLNAQTLDFGNIEFAPDEERESRIRTFRFNREESEKLNFVTFSVQAASSECR